MDVRNKAAGLAACLLLSAFARAHAQSAQTVERSLTALSGGTISQAVVSGRATKEFSITAKGAAKPLVVKRGHRIEALTVQSATVTSAMAHGGKLTVPASPTVDASMGMAEATSLTDATLKDATFKDVKSATDASFKVEGAPVIATLPQDLELEKAETAKPVTVTKPLVSVGSLQKQDKQLGTTTQEKTDWVGDYVILNVDVGQFVLSDSPSEKPVTGKQGTCFRINKEYEIPDPADSTKKKKYVTGSFVTGIWPRFPSLMPPWSCPDDVGEVNPRLSYDAPWQLITEDRDRSRFGYTYGVLVAPFKYYRADRQFSAGASVGPYLGHRIHDRQGSSTVAAIAIGAASTTVKTQNADGTENTSVKTGLSIALAAISQFKDFNVGLIGGRDFYSKSDNVPFSGRVWLSVSFGKKLD
jgi:hypothetical protein